jgi:tRNA1(Val) A37 N6-methylase TrmN6
MTAPLSDDRLLGGRVALLQPRAGFRAAIDPLFLAAAVPAVAGERVLELGTGSGAAALCLARRVAGVEVVGIDIDAGLIAIAQQNARRNGLADRVCFVAADLALPPFGPQGARSFQHVMLNPPFVRDATGRPPPDAGRRRATIEQTIDLDAWIDAAARLVAARGWVTLVHRADRLADILSAMRGRLGALAIFPLWPGGRRSQAAKRVLVQGRLGSSAPLRLCPGLNLHRPDGRFTDAAEAILRHAEPLRWDAPSPGLP